MDILEACEDELEIDLGNHVDHDVFGRQSMTANEMADAIMAFVDRRYNHPEELPPS